MVILMSRAPSELIDRVKASGGGASNPEKDAKIKALTAQMTTLRRDGKEDEAKAVSREISNLRKGDRGEAFVAVLGAEAAKEFMQEQKGGGKKKQESKQIKMSEMSRAEMRKMIDEGADRKTVREKMEEIRKSAKGAGAIAGATRASDLPSPAPRGHMLRIFGQSDREVIENASRESAVPQALNLLNGPVADALINPMTDFARQLAKAAAGMPQMDTIYLGLLSRYPTNNERQVLTGVINERGANASADVIHALMNTGEFLFVK